ncbi:hypothetical protein Ae201684P_012284 [Aphanomyces euteiches]|nr:hypothetical protein Ae201684P_012284 [Aphanomyces euteiches]
MEDISVAVHASDDEDLLEHMVVVPPAQPLPWEIVQDEPDSKSVDSTPYKPMLEAVASRDIEHLRELIDHWDINAVGEIQIEDEPMPVECTPLALASRLGFLDVVRLLLEYDDISIDGPQYTNGSTPLILASQYGHLPVVMTLLLHPVDVDAVNQAHETALWTACNQGQFDVVVALLEHETEQVPDANGVVPMAIAARHGFVDIVRLMSGDGANHTFVASSAQEAVGHGHIDLINMLLETSAVTPDAAMLEIALSNHQFKTANYLVEKLSEGSYNLLISLCLTLLMQDLPVNPNTQVKINHNYSWTTFLDAKTPVPQTLRLEMVQSIAKLVPGTAWCHVLAFEQDRRGRTALEITDDKTQKFLKDQVYFSGRFELGKTIQVTPTSVLIEAIDHDLYEEIFGKDLDKEALLAYGHRLGLSERSLEKLKMAITILNEQFVVDLWSALTTNVDSWMAPDATINLGLYPYVLVCPPIRRTLDKVNVSPVLVEHVVEALTHLHSQGLVHTDVCGRNLFELDNGRVVLGNLEATVPVGAIVPSSSLEAPFLAPEYSSNPKETLAKPAMDAWALGMWIYNGRRPVCTTDVLEANSPLHALVMRLLVVDPSKRSLQTDDTPPIEEPVKIHEVAVLELTEMQSVASLKQSILRGLIVPGTDLRVPTSFILLSMDLSSSQSHVVEDDQIALAMERTLSLLKYLMRAVRQNRSVGGSALPAAWLDKTVYLHAIDEVQGVSSWHASVRFETNSEVFARFLVASMPFLQSGIQLLRPSKSNENEVVASRIRQAQETARIFDLDVLVWAMQAHGSTATNANVRAAAIEQLDRLIQVKTLVQGMGRLYDPSTGMVLWTCELAISAWQSKKEDERDIVSTARMSPQQMFIAWTRQPSPPRRHSQPTRMTFSDEMWWPFFRPNSSSSSSTTSHDLERTCECTIS